MGCDSLNMAHIPVTVVEGGLPAVQIPAHVLLPVHYKLQKNVDAVQGRSVCALPQANEVSLREHKTAGTVAQAYLAVLLYSKKGMAFCSLGTQLNSTAAR